MLEGLAERDTQQALDYKALAWYVEYFARQKRLPSLAEVIKPPTEAPPIEQSRADHAALVAAAENN